MPLTQTPYMLAITSKDSALNNAAAGATSAKENLYHSIYENYKTNHMEYLYQQKQLQLLATNSSSPEVLASSNRNVFEDYASYEKVYNEQVTASDRNLLRLLQDAMAMDQINLALSLSFQIQSMKSLGIGIRLANHLGKVIVAKTLDSILQYRQSMLYAAAALQQPSQSQSQTHDQQGYESQAQHYHQQQQQQQQQQQRQTGAQGNAGGNLLSRKASMRQQPPSANTATANSTSTAAANRATSAKIVSPSVSNESANSNTHTTPSGHNHSDDDQALPPLPPKYHSTPSKSSATKVTPISSDRDHTTVTEGATEDEMSQLSKIKKINPFVIMKTGNTPLKRKSVAEDLQDSMKHSPSPKKPTLSVSLPS
jgi:hypothetical protein